MTTNELQQILKDKFGKVRRNSRGYLNFPCPTCEAKDRKKMKRFILPGRFVSNCWICRVPKLVSDLVGVDNFEVVEPNSTPVEIVENPLARRMPGKRFIPVNQLPIDHPAIKFLHKDHLFDLDDYYNNHGMVYCPSDAGVIFNSKPFTTSSDRLIFPVHFNKEFVGWQMRSIPGTIYGDRPDVIRYWHLFNKGRYLYNFDQASTYRHVVVVEGVKKALKLPNAVATLGKGLAETQTQLLLRWPIITLLFDSDDETQRMSEELAVNLRMTGRKVLNINLMKYGFPSPDEATTDELFRIIHYEWTK